jgi:autophagy-related protein 101
MDYLHCDYGNPQTLDRFTMKEALTAILHSILFHRLFGTVKPKDFVVLDVTMV